MYNYLTETSLKDALYCLFEKEFIHNKQFLGKFRPDYRNDELKLIVEFDGYNHYCNAKRILKDYEKKELFVKNGYKVINIPYFIQLNNEIVELLFHDFNPNLHNFKQTEYAHGFIDDSFTCVLPCDYCSLGTKRFIKDLDIFEIIRNDILLSLKNRISECGEWRLVVNEEIMNRYKNLIS